MRTISVFHTYASVSVCTPQGGCVVSTTAIHPLYPLKYSIHPLLGTSCYVIVRPYMHSGASLHTFRCICLMHQPGSHMNLFFLGCAFTPAMLALRLVAGRAQPFQCLDLEGKFKFSQSRITITRRIAVGLTIRGRVLWY